MVGSSIRIFVEISGEVSGLGLDRKLCLFNVIDDDIGEPRSEILEMMDWEIDRLKCLSRLELETELFNAEFWILARLSYSSVVRGINTKRETEKELGRRLNLDSPTEISGMIWKTRDQQ